MVQNRLFKSFLEEGCLLISQNLLGFEVNLVCFTLWFLVGVAENLTFF